jgi:hypothetical protein
MMDNQFNDALLDSFHAHLLRFWLLLNRLRPKVSLFEACKLFPCKRIHMKVAFPSSNINTYTQICFDI